MVLRKKIINKQKTLANDSQIYHGYADDTIEQEAIKEIFTKINNIERKITNMEMRTKTMKIKKPVQTTVENIYEVFQKHKTFVNDK